MLIAAIDPGLDRVVAAIFDLDKFHPTHQFERAAEAFVSFEELETEPGEPMPCRLRRIYFWANRLHERVWRSFVEEPSIAGAYSRQRRFGVAKNPEAMQKLYMAMGALLAGLQPEGGYLNTVTLVRAPKIPKPKRHQAVEYAMAAAGRTGFGRGPRGGSNADLLDATFLGLWVLTEPGLRPTVGRSTPEAV